jgi:uncharacterized membrane protein
MKRLTVFIATVAFVALSGWDLWEALGNFLGLPGFYVALGLEDRTPWLLLYAGLAVPAISVIVGLWWARRRGLMARILIYVIVLAASNAVAMSLLAGGQAWLAYVLPPLAS